MFASPTLFFKIVVIKAHGGLAGYAPNMVAL
jgi:hypothetical protein